jgi:hypothetical protein
MSGPVHSVLAENLFSKVTGVDFWHAVEFSRNEAFSAPFFWGFVPDRAGHNEEVTHLGVAEQIGAGHPDDVQSSSRIVV